MYLAQRDENIYVGNGSPLSCFSSLFDQLENYDRIRIPTADELELFPEAIFVITQSERLQLRLLEEEIKFIVSWIDEIGENRNNLVKEGGFEKVLDVTKNQLKILTKHLNTLYKEAKYYAGIDLTYPKYVYSEFDQLQNVTKLGTSLLPKQTESVEPNS